MFVGEDPVCDTASAIIRPNILLDRDINAVFAVFGFVAAMPVTVGSTTVVTATAFVNVGVEQGYQAPEVADGKHGTPIDMYSYGVVRMLVLVGFATHYIRNCATGCA